MPTIVFFLKNEKKCDEDEDYGGNLIIREIKPKYPSTEFNR